MALAEALETAKQQPPPKKCFTCKLLNTLPPGDREALAAALADSAYEHVQIAKALAAEGHPIAASSIGRHRNVCGPR